MTKNKYMFIYIIRETYDGPGGWQSFVLLSLWAKDAPAAL